MKCFVRNVLIVFSLSLLVACERDEVVVKHVCEAVDLGLSVKWATCNIGAFAPEEYGCYFAWGETTTKSTFGLDNYKWFTSLDNSYDYEDFTKYITEDHKTTLELSDDAAHVNWGGSWRMPTDAELTELREQCTWTWTSQNGVNGYKVTSKSNGNSIFLPAAASYRDDSSSLNYAGRYGYYWSNSLYASNQYHAWYVHFYSGDVLRDYHNRCYGYTIRPVCP